jgi:hypothetical protein
MTRYSIARFRAGEDAIKQEKFFGTLLGDRLGPHRSSCQKRDSLITSSIAEEKIKKRKKTYSKVIAFLAKCARTRGLLSILKFRILASEP